MQLTTVTFQRVITYFGEFLADCDVFILISSLSTIIFGGTDFDTRILVIINIFSR